MKPFSGLTFTWITIAAVGCCTMACNKDTEYHQWVETEARKGARADSLFLGIYLGMASKDFYAHCWELNKQGYFTQGFGNHSVLYILEDQLKSKALMNFYPTFFEDKIVEMPVRFAYEAWAPWNNDLSVDSLQLDVLKLMKKWYGEKFIEIPNPETGDIAYVRIDGNRRISIAKYNVQEVIVLFTDLEKEKVRKAANTSKR